MDRSLVEPAKLHKEEPRIPVLETTNQKRWSGSIAQLDLLSVALEEKPASLMAIQKFFGVDKYRVKHRYKTYTKVSDDLQDLIYRQFHEFMVGNSDSDPKVLCTHKGSFALRRISVTPFYGVSTR